MGPRPAVLIETDLGHLLIDCLPNRVGENFIKLCKAQYFCNNLVYSVDKGFVAQTGDPSGTGKGGESIWGLLNLGPRFFPDALQPESVWHGRGLVCMALYGSQHTNASAFFLLLGDASDHRYKSLVGSATVVGRVVDGLDTLDRLNDVFVDDHLRPFRDVRLRRAHIIVDPFPDPLGFEQVCVPEADLARYAPRSEVAEERLSVLEENSDDALDPGAREAKRQGLIAEANAVKLEMLGDLPSADFKPVENVLFVCKLNPSTRSEDLELIFSRFGTVLDCEVIRDQRTNDSLQYAFVEFSSKRECEEAYKKMQNVVIDDRRIKVDFSQSTRGGPGRWAMRGKQAGHRSNPAAAHPLPRSVQPAATRLPLAAAPPQAAQDNPLASTSLSSAAPPAEPPQRKPRLESSSEDDDSDSSSLCSSEASEKRSKKKKKKHSDEADGDMTEERKKHKHHKKHHKKKKKKKKHSRKEDD